jgi:hypothetical protein
MRRGSLLAIVVACALTCLASLGAGPASATRLCLAEANPCPGNKQWKTNTKLDLEVKIPHEFNTNEGTVSCATSHVSGETLNDGGGAGVNVTAKFTAFILSSCKLGPTTCTVTDQALPYPLEIAWTMNLEGIAEFSPTFLVECLPTIECTFKAPGVKLSLMPGTTAEMVAKNIVLARSGPNCPASANWNARWIFKSPGPLLFVNA